MMQNTPGEENEFASEDDSQDVEIIETADIIETTDEDGQVHIFEKISEVEVQGQEYALLIYRGQGETESTNGNGKHAPEEGAAEEDDEEVVVMRIGYEDGLEVYEAIEDDEEFERVVAAIEDLDDEDDDSPVAIDLGDLGKPSDN